MLSIDTKKDTLIHRMM